MSTSAASLRPAGALSGTRSPASFTVISAPATRSRARDSFTRIVEAARALGRGEWPY